MGGGEWLVTRASVGLGGIVGEPEPAMGDAGGNSNATNAGNAYVAASAAKASGDGVVSDAGRKHWMNRRGRIRNGRCRRPPNFSKNLGGGRLQICITSSRSGFVSAHEELDAAVATAYGWEANISNDDVIRKLLESDLQIQST